MNQWLWPLPPDGPLTFIAEWPKFGIGETSVSVDGGEIRAAAETVEDLWTRSRGGRRSGVWLDDVEQVARPRRVTSRSRPAAGSAMDVRPV